MTANKEMLFEILLKEEEKYNLKSFGILTDINALCEKISNSLGNIEVASFQEYKETVLKHFYEDSLNYKNFIEENKQKNKLKSHFLTWTKRRIRGLQEKYPAPLDNELKIGKSLSIAYHTAPIILDEFYKKFATSSNSFQQPIAVNTFFKDCIDITYPIDLPKYMDYLSDDDKSFWNETSSYIQQLISIVIRSNYKEANGGDILYDVYDGLKKQLVDKKVKKPTFETGNDFRNYVIRIIHRYLSKSVKDKVETVSFDDFLKKSESTEFEDADISRPHDLEEIDPQNMYEVSYVMTIILKDEKHPMYHQLTRGIEDKVEIIKRIAIDEKRYKELAIEFYGDLNDNELERKTALLRKNFERGRKELQARFQDIINKLPRNSVGFVTISLK